ncbi:hypothetical protein [Haloarcula amylolytica]|uniref:hypothetical protein n=1 Tax=Haloarcula amylolytica TaxID=396317 RepID=UPI001427B8E7|nr:hypothetical protein [Haloarcula amylolytica]
MDTTLDLAALDYEECADDPGWVRCRYCWSKVYAGSGVNKTDLARHAERCEWR